MSPHLFWAQLILARVPPQCVPAVLCLLPPPLLPKVSACPRSSLQDPRRRIGCSWSAASRAIAAAMPLAGRAGAATLRLALPPPPAWGNRSRRRRGGAAARTVAEPPPRRYCVCLLKGQYITVHTHETIQMAMRSIPRGAAGESAPRWRALPPPAHMKSNWRWAPANRGKPKRECTSCRKNIYYKKRVSLLSYFVTLSFFLRIQKHFR